MAKRQPPDLLLLCICGLLVSSGVLILASVSSSFSLERTGNSFTFLNRQLLFGLVPGLVLGGAAFFAPLSLFKRWSFPFLLFSIFLLALVFMPGLGADIRGAQRWIFVGSFSFQPAELLKLALILYIASWLASRASLRKQTFKKTFLPFVAVMTVVSIFLVLQRDVGTLAVVAATGLAMYFLASTPVWHTFVFAGFGIVAFALLITLEPYRWARLKVFLDPSLDPLGKGYQVKQALIGIGSGGLLGTGLGLSFQKFGSLPAPISDSIFAVFAEEVGFVGSFVLILLFVAFVWRALVCAKRAPDVFASLTAAGIGVWIFLQTSVHIGANLGLLPLTGIPLPFVSHGGSALVSELIALGILLNISKQAHV